MNLLKPEFGPEDIRFPPLPPIFSTHILQQVFTHRSFYARPTHVFEDRSEDPSPDNEKFEHLGDTVLGLAVTSLLLDMYPYLRVGPSTKIRAKMVGNTTLAVISLKYKLPERLRLHPAQRITLKASPNVQADVFESYVGGLYTDQGLEAVQTWLKPLFTPYAEAAYQMIRTEHGLPPLPTPVTTPKASPDALPISSPAAPAWVPEPVPQTGAGTTGHLALFNQQLQKEHREIEWEYTPGGGEGAKTTPMWLVRVLVDSECYGQGRGSTKRAARNEAAKEGLKKLGIFV